MIVPPTLTLIMLGPSAAVRDAAIGAVLPINRHDSEYCEERDQFLERYYRLVTQFELMGGSFDRARAGITDAIGYLRGRPERNEQHEIPALPVSKSPGNGNGLENGVAKIAATLEGERRREEALVRGNVILTGAFNAKGD